jgi:hypothetical protein
MQCSYVIGFGGRSKLKFCPSGAHEGLVNERGEIIMYCSHHRRVVEAKATFKAEKKVEVENAPVR